MYHKFVAYGFEFWVKGGPSRSAFVQGLGLNQPMAIEPISINEVTWVAPIKRPYIFLLWLKPHL